MASTPVYTAEELAEIERLRSEIAAEEARISPKDLPSEAEEARKRMLLAAKNAGIQIVTEATAAALAQKAALPFAPYTFGMSVPIAGAIAGFGGYEAAMRATGQEPTMLGRLQAAGMGAIPFAPEARLATTAAGNLARVTAPEVAQSAMRMGGATGAATIAPKLAMGEEVGPSDIIPAVTGAAGGAMARLAGAATATSQIAGRPGETATIAAAGPSAKAAAAAIEKAQNVSRDAQLQNWLAVGGVLDPVRFNPGMVTRTVEKAIGEPQVALEELRRINMAKAGEVVRAQIGLAPSAELKLDAYTKRRQEVGEAYEAVRNLGPTAEKALDKLEEARDVMRRSWREWRAAKDQNKGTTPSLLTNAEEATQTVEMLENRLESIVKKSGNSGMYDRLVAARPQLAQIWVAESATNYGPNIIDPSVLGNIHNASPKLLTDGLRMIAEVYNTQPDAFGTRLMREMARERRMQVPAILRAGIGGGVGYQFGGTPLTAGIGIVGGLLSQTATDVASSAIRRSMLPFMTGSATFPGVAALSQRYQNVYGFPQYGTNVPTPLSLLLAKAGGPSGVELQQFLAQQQAAQSP